MTTVEVIKSLCEKNGLSIAQLEKELNYGNGSLSKSKTVKSDRLLEIARKFNVSLEYLVTGKDEPQARGAQIGPDISRCLQDLLKGLNCTPAELNFGGKPLDEKTIGLLCAGLNHTLQIAEISLEA